MSKQYTDALTSATILMLATLAESRDHDTGNHIFRTREYVRVLAKQLQSTNYSPDELNDEQINIMFEAAPLHDIGKIGIPDYLLLKTGKLNAAEWGLMRTHTTFGGNAINDVILKLTSSLHIEDREKFEQTDLKFLQMGKQIALSHHEHWDGNGYPDQLKGTDIPLAARIMAVADVYDALTCIRHYKSTITHSRAVALIEEGSGSHFDPSVVDAFLCCQDKFITLSQIYADPI